MKTGKALFAAVLLGLCPSVWAQYNTGISDLTGSNITGALTAFNAATPASNPNAAVYLAFTRLLALPNDSMTSSFLTQLGISASGRDVYHWQAQPHKDPNGHSVFLTTFNTGAMTAEIKSDIIPTLILCQSNLAQVTSTSFTLQLQHTVTHFQSDATVDYGDVQMLRAILDAETMFGYEVSTWDLEQNYGAASNIIKDDKSIEALLTNNTALLAITNAGNLALARGVFTNAVNEYFAASQFIRNRPPNGPRYLFNLDANELQEEQNFRTTLANLLASLNGPVQVSANSTTAINMGALFSYNGVTNLRAFLPRFANRSADFIWDSFPDTTLGGVVNGLTETNLGKLFLKKFNAQAELAPTNLTYSIVAPVPDNSQLGGSLNGVVAGPGGILYGTAPYGGNFGEGAFFKATTSGSFTLLYSFGAGQTNMYGGPLSGGSPSSLVLGSDGKFYGTTSQGGANGNGTIFRITTAGAVSKIYSFGDQNDNGSSGGNPLILGSDGNLYGDSPNGGNNNAGTIFQITGATGSSPTINVIGSFPAVVGNNVYGSGVGPGALLQGRDGNFYGVTQFGGTEGGGSLFEFTPSANGGQFQGYSLPQLTDQYGNQIVPSLNTLIQASNGLFYGTGEYGGPNYASSSTGQGDGLLFSWDGQGTPTLLYSFDETNFDGYNPVGTLAQGTNGNFYGITSAGGANGRGAIFEYAPGAGVSFLVWFDEGLGKQQNNNYGYYYGAPINGGLTQVGSYAYGTAPDGGPNGNGVVFSITPNYNSPPTIATPPAGGTFVLGSSPTLTVSATGTGNLTYQWEKQGGTLPANVSGATTSSLTFRSLTAADAGAYFVVVRNAYGTADSDAAQLTVAVPPTITSQPVASVSVVQGNTVSLRVGTAGPGPISWQWRVGTTDLADGNNIIGSLTSNIVISPAVTGNTGHYSVVVSNPNGSVTSIVSTVTVAVDHTSPGITITAPTPGARVTAPVTFGGTASETGVPITSVNYWITNMNGSPLLSGQANLSVGPGSASNWSVASPVVTPYPGSNTLVVQSQDFSGNKSLFVPLKFFLRSPAPLTLAAAGTGTGTFTGTASIHTDTPPGSNALLNLGESYSITAVPAANNYFLNWSGTVPTTTNPVLNFIMQNGTTITGTFVTNIFNYMAGTYNGLFTNGTLGVTEETAGMIANLKVTNTGVYSATVKLGSTSVGISGTFTHEGYASNHFSSTLDGAVGIILQVNANSAPRTITGSVLGTNSIISNGAPVRGWTSDFTLVASLTGSSFDAGAYNFLIPPSAPTGAPAITGNSASSVGGVALIAYYNGGGTLNYLQEEETEGGNSIIGLSSFSLIAPAGVTGPLALLEPPGYGYALLSNNPATATVNLSGLLADGTSFSQSVPVGEDNGIPFFASYSSPNNGVILGQLSLSNTPAAAAPSGSLTWIRKAGASGLFHAGFTNVAVTIQGSSWSNAAPFDSPSFQIMLSDGGLAAPQTINATLSRTNLVLAGTTTTVGFINTNTGLFSVTFTNGGPQTARGAFLQNAEAGDGFFLLPSASASPTNAGTVSIVNEPFAQPAGAR